ncbi:hypothetical protein [Nereida sp. MMG025]|uniref:hypothetical protein n=1 Tax=Nereida sp. MMG025 TaxID=2909981 RepID=UPI001F31A3C2|nr:hypothetical protein [Nereida sp. MMG025]MCF6446159.1 hypothetical protein [Nereida sp. MMG025]
MRLRFPFARRALFLVLSVFPAEFRFHHLGVAEQAVGDLAVDHAAASGLDAVAMAPELDAAVLARALVLEPDL